MPKVLMTDNARFQQQMLAWFGWPKNSKKSACRRQLQTFMMALDSTPDLVLPDVPGGTETEVLKALRVSNNSQHIPGDRRQQRAKSATKSTP